MDTMLDQRMRDCIQECHRCHDTCLETTAHCLELGGEHAEPVHVQILMDCAELCQTSANFMLRMSDMHGDVCGLCADACARCAEDCERFSDDSMMKQCAEICRSCEQSCNEMAETA